MFGFQADGVTPKNEIILPGMDIGTTAKFNAYELTFADAIAEQSEHKWFTSTEQSIIQRYVQSATAAYMPHASFLGL